MNMSTVKFGTIFLSLLVLALAFSACSNDLISPDTEQNNFVVNNMETINSTNDTELKSIQLALNDSNIVCANISREICGIDGVTYQNVCFAQKANVQIAKPVPCDVEYKALATVVRSTSFCQNVTDSFVCTLKNITFSSKCLADFYNQTVLYVGACK